MSQEANKKNIGGDGNEGGGDNDQKDGGVGDPRDSSSENIGRQAVNENEEEKSSSQSKKEEVEKDPVSEKSSQSKKDEERKDPVSPVISENEQNQQIQQMQHGDNENSQNDDDFFGLHDFTKFKKTNFSLLQSHGYLTWRKPRDQNCQNKCSDITYCKECSNKCNHVVSAVNGDSVRFTASAIKNYLTLSVQYNPNDPHGKVFSMLKISAQPTHPWCTNWDSFEQSIIVYKAQALNPQWDLYPYLKRKFEGQSKKHLKTEQDELTITRDDLSVEITDEERGKPQTTIIRVANNRANFIYATFEEMQEKRAQLTQEVAELDVKMEIQRPIIEDDDDIQTGDQMSDESDSLFVQEQEQSSQAQNVDRLRNLNIQSNKTSKSRSNIPVQQQTATNAIQFSQDFLMNIITQQNQVGQNNQGLMNKMNDFFQQKEKYKEKELRNQEMEILKKELEIKYLKKTSSKRRGRRGRHSESPSSSSSGGEHPHASSADEKHSTQYRNLKSKYKKELAEILRKEQQSRSNSRTSQKRRGGDPQIQFARSQRNNDAMQRLQHHVKGIYRFQNECWFNSIMVGFFSVPNVWRNIKISRDNDPNTVWPFFDGLHSLLELFGFRSTLAITIPIIFERMENFDFKRTNCVLDQWTVICSIIKCEKGESHLARGLEHELQTTTQIVKNTINGMRYQNYQALNLEYQIAILPQNALIDDLISYKFNSENFEWVDTQKVECQRVTTLRLVSLPQTLVIGIQRWEEENAPLNRTVVNLRPTLPFGALRFENSPQDNQIYGLKCVIEHVDGIHFIAYIKEHKTNNWYMVNDNVVIPATFTDFAFSKSCVLLMYDMEQVGKTPEEDFLGITNPPGQWAQQFKKQFDQLEKFKKPEPSRKPSKKSSPIKVPVPSLIRPLRPTDQDVTDLKEKIIEEEIQFKPKESDKDFVYIFEDKFQCHICLYGEDITKIAIKLACGHVIHSDCLRDQYDSVKDVKEFEKMQMKCGVPDCGVVIDYSYVELITEPKIFNVYKEKMVEAFKKTNKRIVVCPTNNCHSCIELFSDQKDDDGVQHECVNCHLVYCTKCECEWHEGYSCNDYLDLVVEADFMKESKVPIYTRCPGCKHAVQKTKYCNHMTCRCKTEFCYLCSMKYTYQDGYRINKLPACTCNQFDPNQNETRNQQVHHKYIENRKKVFDKAFPNKQMSIVKQILADLNKKDEKEGKKIVPKPKPKPKPKPYGVEEEYVPTENQKKDLEEANLIGGVQPKSKQQKQHSNQRIASPSNQIVLDEDEVIDLVEETKILEKDSLKFPFVVYDKVLHNTGTQAALWKTKENKKDAMNSESLEYTQRDIDIMRRAHSKINRYKNSTKYRTVMDLACGDGRQSLWGYHYKQIHLLDINTVLLNRAIFKVRLNQLNVGLTLNHDIMTFVRNDTIESFTHDWICCWAVNYILEIGDVYEFFYALYTRSFGKGSLIFIKENVLPQNLEFHIPKNCDESLIDQEQLMMIRTRSQFDRILTEIENRGWWIRIDSQSVNDEVIFVLEYLESMPHRTVATNIETAGKTVKNKRKPGAKRNKNQ